MHEITPAPWNTMRLVMYTQSWRGTLGDYAFLQCKDACSVPKVNSFDTIFKNR